MRTSKFIWAGISVAAALTFATSASASAVVGPCTNLTDGTASSCKFSGNINTNTVLNGNSYLDAQNAYNAYAPTVTPTPWPADLVLTPLADFGNDDNVLAGSSLTIGDITLMLNADGNGGTVTAGAGIALDYLAVKSGPAFILYELGPGSTFTFDTDGLQNGNNTSNPTLSHLLAFGGPGGGVPEPATWAMMLLGVGMIGSSMRRRKQKQARPTVLA